MARLPVPGSDNGNWGEILNDYLSASHNADGTLKTGVVNGAILQNGSVTQTKLSTTNSASDGQVLATNGSQLSWTTVSGSGSVADASSSTKGVVQLAGDLAGTAAAPTVPGLAAKADNSTTVHLTGNESVAGIKNFTGTLQVGGQAVVATNDTRLTDLRTPTNASVTPAKLAATAAPTNGQILSYNGTQFNWVAAPTGGADPTLGGDLTGTASNAQIAANAVTAAKILDNTITEPKLAVSNAPGANQVLTWNGTTLVWTTPASGGGGGGGAYDLGRVRFEAGWPSTRPTGYAYIDWIKSSSSDPDPSSSLMVAGDTISEWS